MGTRLHGEFRSEFALFERRCNAYMCLAIVQRPRVADSTTTFTTTYMPSYPASSASSSSLPRAFNASIHEAPSKCYTTTVCQYIPLEENTTSIIPSEVATVFEQTACPLARQLGGSCNRVIEVFEEHTTRLLGGLATVTSLYICERAKVE